MSDVTIGNNAYRKIAIGGSIVNRIYEGSTLIYAGLPGIPQGLTAAAGNGQISLSWSAPDSGGTVRSYLVQWKASGQNYSSVRQKSVTARTTTITGLTNLLLYAVRVRAVNSQGNSGWSAEDMAVPGGLTITFNADGSFVWPWADRSTATIVLRAGAGGGGGGGGGGGAAAVRRSRNDVVRGTSGGDGTDGTDGGDTSLTRNSTIESAAGGAGGGGGAGGRGATARSRSSNTTGANGAAGDPDSSDAGAIAGGAGGNRGEYRGDLQTNTWAFGGEAVEAAMVRLVRCG